MTEVREQKSDVRDRKAGWTAMTKKIIFLALCSLLLAPCSSVEAQQPKKVRRIGYLTTNDSALESSRAEAIRLALRDLDYIEGQNIAIEYPYMQGKVDRAPELAAELVRLKVDIILVAGGDIPIRTARMRLRRFPS
jgi:hypothetical protein